MVLYATTFYLFLAVVVVVGLAIAEYYRITMSQNKGFLFVGTSLGLTVPVIMYLFGLQGFFGYLIPIIFFIFTYFLFAHNPLPSVTNRIGVGVLGVIYIPFFLSHLLLIRDLEQGRLWVLFLFFVIGANDTCAYYVGKGIGRYKLSPVVSPNKTIEGAGGGLIGGMVITIAFQHFFFAGITLKEAVVLSLCIGIVGQLSDLFESLIKRGVGVKDSGNLLPGHGGVLDRIDSLIFPIPFLYYYLTIFKTIH